MGQRGEGFARLVVHQNHTGYGDAPEHVERCKSSVFVLVDHQYIYYSAKIRNNAHMCKRSAIILANSCRNGSTIYDNTI